MSYLSRFNGIKFTFYNSNVFVNGSKFGVFVSALDPNNKLFMNPDYNKIGMLLSKDELESDGIKTITQIEKRLQFKDHPDFQYIFGLFYVKQKNYKKALSYFEDAYKNYNSNDSVINAESEFLQDYIKLFKHLQ